MKPYITPDSDNIKEVNMRKKVIVLFAILLIVLCICSLGKSMWEKKGGEDALTVFSINSSEIELICEGNKVILMGEERADFIKIVKDTINHAEDATEKDIEYDLTIDFKNGYKAYLSTEEKIMCFEENRKCVKEDDLQRIMGYLKN